ncbi:MAG: sulfite exporter TauE/SafE family protein [Acidimicrobiales bacterium]
MTVTLGWLVYVLAAGHIDRVGDNLIASVTMIFGSFVAGSTPQGGGAVAFPVFTKGLEIPAEVARTFSLSIQTIGMGTASLAIAARSKPVERRALMWGIPAAVIGFLFGLYVLGDPDLPYWPSRVPGPWVKVLFTVLIASMAAALWLEYRAPLIERRFSLASTMRVRILLVTALFVGGVISSLTGSGTDVVLYVLVAVVLGVSPQVAVPTSVMAMAAVSIVGLLVLGLYDGQLATTLDGSSVTELGGDAVRSVDGKTVFADQGDLLEATRFDLFGLWLAAVPVVAWGAPLGAWLASRMRDRHLVRLVVALASLEVLSTIIFLEELRSDAVLAVSGALGVLLVTALLAMARKRRASLTDGPVDVVGGDRIDVDDSLAEALKRKTPTNPTEGDQK